jgi:outer membrane autotransporter protein
MTMDIARATPGSDLVLDSVVIDVTGDNFPGVRDAGDAFRISITDSVITANGQFSHGVALSGVNTSVTVSDSAVSTLGESSHGFNFAGVDETGKMTRTEVTTRGDNSFALNLSQGAEVEVLSVNLSTGGRYSSAANMLGNSQLNARDSNFKTSGNNAYGLYLLGQNTSQRALANVTDSTIQTTGDNAIAVNVNRNATAILDGTSVYTLGAGAYGVWVPDRDSQLIARDFSIDTQGENAIGVFTQLGGRASLNTGSIHTKGNQAYALYAGNVSTIEGQNLSLRVGANSVGAFATDRSQIKLDNIDLSSDQTAIGLAAYSGSIIEANNSSIQFSGSAARAVQANNGAALRLDHLNISANGIDSIGLQSLANAGTRNIFELGNTNVDVAQGRAISVQGGSAQISLNASRLRAETLLSIDQRLLADGSIVESEDVLITASGSILTGAVQADAINSQLFLEDQSSLSGTVHGLNELTLKQSSWDMTDSSQLGQLNLADGVVRFSGGKNNVLAIDGDLTGNGTFLMNSDLASQQGDLIKVGGSTQGAHILVVEDSGNEPVMANGRLMLVDGSGGSGSFSLYGGHVDAGAFRYTLEQSANDWFLVSPANLPIDPNDPISPGTPTPGRLSAGANSAIASQAAGATLWSAQMNALVKRLGELRLGKDEGGIWTRAIGSRYNIAEHSSRAFSQTNTGVEIGADKAVMLATGKVYLGGMLGTAKSDLNFGERTSGQINSRMVGGYATYLNDNGVYVDSVIKYSRFNHDLKLKNNLGNVAKGSYDSNGYGIDVEVGKHIPLKDSWFIEPQIELSAARTSAAQYTLTNGLRVEAENMDSLQSRIGTVFGSSLELGNSMKAQPYVKASYISELAGESHVKVNGQKLKSELPADRLEFGFGGVLQIDDSSKISFDTDFAKGNDIEQPWGMTIGYRYLW